MPEEASEDPADAATHDDTYDDADDDADDEPYGDEPADTWIGARDGGGGAWAPVQPGHATVRRARARYGLLGAAMAGAMVALRDLLEKPKDDAAVVVEAASEPVDLDEQGFHAPLDDGLAVKAPPQPRPVADPAVARQWAQRTIDRNRRRR